MQFTEILSEKQINNLDVFADELFENTEPDMIDESIEYVLKRYAIMKSKLDKLPSGNIVIAETYKKIKKLKKEGVYGVH